jgi:signal transduction histidine kinase
VLALVLGSFVIRELSHGIYVIALAQTLFGIAVVLVGLSWLWYPHRGFTGVGFLLSSYLMSMGLPFERWVQRLAQLAQDEMQPERFLANALEHMLHLPWVKRVEWHTPLVHGEIGARTAYPSAVAFGELELVIYTPWAPSSSILLHLKLLTQMVGYFYEAKQREHLQRQNAYTYAIYETGARLTHDVKNLLQSLKSLCAAAAGATPEQAPALHALIQRQLPQITQRLNTTLDKLRSPLAAEMSEVQASAWWENLMQRYIGRKIAFELEGDMRPLQLPAELFDNVADNLIENAFNKSSDLRTLEVRVTFACAGRGTLAVCDNGTALSQTLASQLFEGPVLSHTGFGVGLFQSSRLAAQSGYRLALAANRPGSVCFMLESEPAADARAVDRQVA